jgi:outer membrane lipoprotein-sorting protein
LFVSSPSFTNFHQNHYTIMKKIILSLFFVGAIYAVSAQDTPSADAIIDKYLAAVGGKEAIAKIEDLTIGTIAETQRGSMESEVKVKKPNKFASVMYMMGNEVMRATCDGTKVATVSGFGGNTNNRMAEGNDAVAQILQNVPFPEMLYAEYKIEKKVVGKEAVNGKDAWKVELAIPEGRKWNDYFDVESGLKVKRTAEGGMRPGGGQGGPRPDGQRPEGQAGAPAQAGTPGQGGGGGQRGGMGGMGGGMMNVTFGDYKEIKDGNGVKIPYTREQGNGQFSSKAEVSSVKINKGIKDSNFVIK